MVLVVHLNPLDAERLCCSIINPHLGKCLELERYFLNVLPGQKFKDIHGTVRRANINQVVFGAYASELLVLERLRHALVVDVSLLEVARHSHESPVPLAQTSDDDFVVSVWPQPLIVELLQIRYHERILSCVHEIDCQTFKG